MGYDTSFNLLPLKIRNVTPRKSGMAFVHGPIVHPARDLNLAALVPFLSMDKTPVNSPVDMARYSMIFRISYMSGG